MGTVLASLTRCLEKRLEQNFELVHNTAFHRYHYFLTSAQELTPDVAEQPLFL